MPKTVQFDNDFLMSPKNDFAFKRIFGDERNKDILIAFLNAVLNMPGDELEGIELINTELKKEYIEDRKGILDVRARTHKGTNIDIEIQLIETYYMAERTLYYWAKMFNDQLKSGDNYETLKKTITINIVDFDCIPDKKYHSVFHISEDETGTRLTDVLEIHFLEMRKLPAQNSRVDIDDALMQWMMFIESRSKEVLDMLADKNKSINKAYEVLKILSKDEEARAQYLSREMAIHDEVTRLDVAVKKGRAEGRTEGKIEVARNMLNKGMSTTLVAEFTGLTAAEIESLNNETDDGMN